jgi:linoleoyl-CoA desaturase
VATQRSPAAAAARVRFDGVGEFSRLLSLNSSSLLGDPATLRGAYWRIWLKAGIVMAWAVGSYLVLLLAATTPLAAAAACLSLGLAAAGIGFCIMHDANHGAFSTNTMVNRVAAHSLDLLGGSSYVWRAKHLAHHTYTNVAEHDPDVDALPFARFEPSQRRRPWHRYQHYYIWVLYAFVTLRWQIITDFTILARGRVGQSSFKRPRGWNLGGLVIGKAAFVTWAILIPLVLHRPFPVFAALIVTSAVASLALTVTFQLSHCLEEATTLAVPYPAARAEWHVHQVEATVDFAQKNTLMRWYLGGLNHQIEHHLYPRLPHTLHHTLADIVRRTASDCDIAYHTHPTIRAALRSHTAWLKHMGSRA